jgi:hypothetical protein
MPDISTTWEPTMLLLQHPWAWVRLLLAFLVALHFLSATQSVLNAYSQAASPRLEGDVPRPVRDSRSPLDDHGGADAFGYGYMDNVAPDTATYAWIELRGDPHATLITDWSDNNDGCASSLCSIGFSFPFYGETCTTFKPNTDGQIEFGNCSALPDTFCMPESAWGPSILQYMYYLRLRYGGYESTNTPELIGAQSQ